MRALRLTTMRTGVTRMSQPSLAALGSRSLLPLSAVSPAHRWCSGGSTAAKEWVKPAEWDEAANQPAVERDRSKEVQDRFLLTKPTSNRTLDDLTRLKNLARKKNRHMKIEREKDGASDAKRGGDGRDVMAGRRIGGMSRPEDREKFLGKNSERVAAAFAAWHLDGTSGDAIVTRNVVDQLLLHHGLGEIGMVAEKLEAHKNGSHITTRNMLLKSVATCIDHDSNDKVMSLALLERMEQWFNESPRKNRKTYAFLLEVVGKLSWVRPYGAPLGVSEGFLYEFGKAGGSITVDVVNRWLAYALASDPLVALSAAEAAITRNNVNGNEVSWARMIARVRWNAEGLKRMLSSRWVHVSEGLLVPLVKQAVRTKDDELARALWKDAESLGLENLSFESWVAFLSFHASRKNVGDLLDLLKKMAENFRVVRVTNGRPDEEVDESLVPEKILRDLAAEAMPTAEEVDAAYFEVERRHNEGEETPLAALNLILAGCANLKDLERAYNTFAVIEAFGLPVHVASYNQLLHTAYAVGDANNVENLLHEMREANVEPDAQSLASLIALYVDTENIGGLDDVLIQARRQRLRLRPETYSKAIQCLIRKKEWSFAHELIESLTFVGIVAFPYQLQLEGAYLADQRGEEEEEEAADGSTASEPKGDSEEVADAKE